MQPDDEQLTSHLGAVLERLLGEGFKPPLRFAVIAGNGEYMVGRFEAAASELEPYQDASSGGFLALPINLMFVDSRGKAARVLLDTSGEPRFFN